jgi:hypothetical protein
MILTTAFHHCLLSGPGVKVINFFFFVIDKFFMVILIFANKKKGCIRNTSFSSQLMNGPNKLVCLSLASLKMFAGKARVRIHNNAFLRKLRMGQIKEIVTLS